MENPNTYDDDAFLQASNEIRAKLPGLVDDLWNAGASADDIKGEIENALGEAEAPIDMETWG